MYKNENIANLEAKEDKYVNLLCKIYDLYTKEVLTRDQVKELGLNVNSLEEFSDIYKGLWDDDVFDMDDWKDDMDEDDDDDIEEDDDDDYEDEEYDSDDDWDDEDDDDYRFDDEDEDE